uniref:Uncharacterized protein n=1 Tax=Anopheles stephensi TaxID=30069 RepID=A0A182XY88_ANOST
MATSRNILQWKLVTMFTVLLVLFITETSSASLLSGLRSSSTRLRRVHKSTYSETNSSEHVSMKSMAGDRMLKSHLLETPLGMGRSLTAKKTTVTTMKSTIGTTLRQRVDQAVQKVRTRSKEIKMEQEQKRVDRKLRRDQKKQERDQTAPVAPINPHNLKMPDCPAGKVYNGRRCVAMGKMAKN